jgi:hypothetical protein
MKAWHKSVIVIVCSGLIAGAIADLRGWPLWAAGLVGAVTPVFLRRLASAISLLRKEMVSRLKTP